MSEATPLARLKETLLPNQDVRSSFLVTYGLDARFFEAEVLPALVPTKLGNDASTGSLSAYLHDADQAAATTPIDVLYDHLLGDGPQLFQSYRQITLGGQAFHPKLVTAEYEDRLRVIVASANLTRPGWTSLFELFVAEDLVQGEQHPWAAGLRTFVRGASEAAGGVRPAAQRVLDFLAAVPDAPEATLHHSFDSALIDAALPTAGVSAIDIVSPFFEGEDGDGLFDELQRRFPAAQLRLFLFASEQAEAGYVVHGPPEKLQALRDGGAELRLIHTSWDGDDDRAPDLRGLHGKLLAFRLGRRHHVVIGSANATRAALIRPVAKGGNAELVATLDMNAAQYQRLLPPSFGTDKPIRFDPGDPTGEDEPPRRDAARFVASAAYAAVAQELRLELIEGAPKLEVRYAGQPLGTAAGRSWSAPMESLGADAYVTVDAGEGPSAVPFVLVDPESLVPRGSPIDLDLEGLADLLAGRRELSHVPGDVLPPRTTNGDNGGSPIFGRGAIPWRRILAGLAGLHDDLVQQLPTPEAVRWTLANPLRLGGLLDRFKEAHEKGRFLDGDLAFALHETNLMLRRVGSATEEAPRDSAQIVDDTRRAVAEELSDLLMQTDPTIRQQLAVLEKMAGSS